MIIFTQYYFNMATSSRQTSPDLGLLILRLGTGFLLLLHGIAKLQHGHDAIKDMLTRKGLPEILWLGVPLTEVLCPVFLILGFFTRFSGLGIATVMAFSIYLAKSAEAFTLTRTGGLSGELNLLFLCCGLALFFTGGGKYAVYRPGNQWLK